MKIAAKNRKLFEAVRSYKRQGIGNKEIAKKLIESGYSTKSGCPITTATISDFWFNARNRRKRVSKSKLIDPTNKPLQKTAEKDTKKALQLYLTLQEISKLKHLSVDIKKGIMKSVIEDNFSWIKQ